MINHLNRVLNLWEYGQIKRRGPGGRILKGTEMARRRRRSGFTQAWRFFSVGELTPGFRSWTHVPAGQIIQFIPA